MHTLSLSLSLALYAYSLSLSLSQTHTRLHTHTYTHTLWQGPHRGRSFTTQRSVSRHTVSSTLLPLSLSLSLSLKHTLTHTTQVRDQVGLDPVQRENLRKLTMSYKSNPNAVHSHTLTKPISTLSVIYRTLAVIMTRATYLL